MAGDVRPHSVRRHSCCRVLGRRAGAAGDADGAHGRRRARRHERNPRAGRLRARRVLGESHGHSASACRGGDGDLQHCWHSGR